MPNLKKYLTGESVQLTEGPIIGGIIAFTLPIFLGQLLQQLYNLADAWVIGQFASDEAFAAVSTGGNLTFLVTGFFNGMGIGGGVIISKYFGAKDEENISRSIHTTFLFGLLVSVLSSVAGVLLAPWLLALLNTPADVMPYSLTYFRIYFAGVSTVILYNMCMAIMRSLGDSLHPLYYLMFSSLTNVLLDLLLVAVFQMGVAGAAIATVLTQALSVLLCLRRMVREPGCTRLEFGKLRFHLDMMRQVVGQGLPTGVQNAVISIGNLVIQSHINSFGKYAMAGQGAYARIEGVVFLPIMSISMALSTFVSQNLGARQYDRAKKGAAFGIVSGMALAELIGFVFLALAPTLLRIFIDNPESLSYGLIHVRIAALFYCLLAFSHCAAGIMRGCGRAVVPMVSMLVFWCAARVIYISCVLQVFPVYDTIPWAYPITWTMSSILFAVFLLKTDWVHTFERRAVPASH